MAHSHIYAENVKHFTLNCGDYGLTANAGCLQNELYLPSNSTINCYGESCRGSSIHTLNGMENIKINTISNCECPKDIRNCDNYWYLFCHENVNKIEIEELQFLFGGYVTFRNYQCLTDDITKCNCNLIKDYVLSNFRTESNDENIECGLKEEILINDDNIWNKFLDKLGSEQGLIWCILGFMVIVVIILMIYLCKIKMTAFNEIQSLTNYDFEDIINDERNQNSNILVP